MAIFIKLSYTIFPDESAHLYTLEGFSRQCKNCGEKALRVPFHNADENDYELPVYSKVYNI